MVFGEIGWLIEFTLKKRKKGLGAGAGAGALTVSILLMKERT